jgi:RHS repeat-associated protein
LDYEYKGTPRSVTFPDGTSTEFRYNEQVKLTDLHTRRGVKEHYEYDADGDLTAITDGNGNRTQFEYGMWNRPDRTRYPDGSSEQYQYGPEGLLQRLIAADGTGAEIEYAEAGKPEEIRYSDGQVLRFEYNGQGQITQAQNAEATLNYTYDGEGRLLSEECDGQKATYHYDEIGALAGITYPSGETVEFEYDADYRLTAIKDWQGQYHRFYYLNNDGGVEHQAPNGVTTTTQLSPLGHPLDISARDSDNNPLFSFKYQYDSEGRVKSFSDSDYGARTYQYDADNQLLGVQSQNNAQLNEQFSYDGAGNRTECNGEKARFNGLNQLLEQGQSQCAYDERGNLIEYRTPGEVWRYTFDARNQLIRAESSTGTDVRFGYDAFGRRVWKREARRKTIFFWLGENLIGETLHENDQLLSRRDYLYAIGTFAPMAAQINGELCSYHYDNLGTPRRLTDKHGKVVWATDYEAFGGAIVRVKGTENNLRFPGHYFDLETGLHYNRFRYYSPIFGRYLNKDPLGHVGGINLYNFIGNSPPNQTDGFGLLWKTVAAIGAGIAVGALVVVTAPVSAPVALGLGLAAGGFTAGALNEGLNNGFNLKCVLMEGIHGMLDALGFIPGIGEIFDGINGIIYLAEGRHLEAGLSFASMIPFGDWLAKPMKWMSKTPLGKVLIGAATPAIKKVWDSKVVKATKEAIRNVASKLGDAKAVKKITKYFDETAEATQKLKNKVLEGGTKVGDDLLEPKWLQNIRKGNEFNAAQRTNYPYNEVYVNKPGGKGYYKLDSYNPNLNEIVSRKHTQLSEINTDTAKSYIKEIPKKYSNGSTISNVPSNIDSGLAGQRLQGQHILEVPVQNNPVPQAVVDVAEELGVVIRDTEGFIYN